MKCIFFLGGGGGGAKYKKGTKMTKRAVKSYLTILFTEPIIDSILRVLNIFRIFKFHGKSHQNTRRQNAFFEGGGNIDNMKKKSKKITYFCVKMK